MGVQNTGKEFTTPTADVNHACYTGKVLCCDLSCDRTRMPGHQFIEQFSYFRILIQVIKELGAEKPLETRLARAHTMLQRSEYLITDTPRPQGKSSACRAFF